MNKYQWWAWRKSYTQRLHNLLRIKLTLSGHKLGCKLALHPYKNKPIPLSIAAQTKQLLQLPELLLSHHYPLAAGP